VREERATTQQKNYLESRGEVLNTGLAKIKRVLEDFYLERGPQADGVG